MKMENVSDEYVKCPECNTPMPNSQVEIKYKPQKEFFPTKFDVEYIDNQCPKCFKIWRREGPI